MSREIKFRAWNLISQQMHDVSELQLKQNGIRPNTNGGAVIHVDRFDVFCESEKLELMQYTGLRDKNGTEIYEGDILQLFAEFDEGYCPYHKTQVTFENGGFCLRDPFEYGDTPIFIHNFLEDMCNGVEVIGNIYENADLLTNTVSE